MDDDPDQSKLPVTGRLLAYSKHVLVHLVKDIRASNKPVLVLFCSCLIVFIRALSGAGYNPNVPTNTPGSSSWSRWGELLYTNRGLEWAHNHAPQFNHYVHDFLERVGDHHVLLYHRDHSEDKANTHFRTDQETRVSEDVATKKRDLNAENAYPTSATSSLPDSMVDQVESTAQALTSVFLAGGGDESDPQQFSPTVPPVIDTDSSEDGAKAIDPRGQTSPIVDASSHRKGQPRLRKVRVRRESP